MKEPKTTEGSFLAVLRDGSHVRYSSYFWSFAEFKNAVRNYLGDDNAKMLFKFFYAYGLEVQEYTPAEMRRVFFGE